MEIVVTMPAMVGLECVRLDGWTVVAVAMLLTAPRLARDFLERSEG